MILYLSKTEASIPNGWSDQNLLDRVSRLARGIAKYYGFWPFELRDGKLDFNWFSAGCAYILVSTVLLLASNIIIAVHACELFSEAASEEGPQSSTEATGQFLQVLTKTFTVIFLQISMLVNRKQIVSMWNNATQLLARICAKTSVYTRTELNTILLGMNRETKFSLLLLYLLSFSTSFSQVWPLLPFIFTNLSLWRACLSTFAILCWNHIADMHFVIIGVVITIMKTLRLAYFMLNKQLNDLKFQQKLAVLKTLAVRSRISGILTHGRELEKLVEELNSSMKYPLVAVVIAAVINLTISVFFISVSFQRYRVGILGNAFDLLLFLLMLHKLCTTGTKFTEEALDYGIALGNVELADIPLELFSKVTMESVKLHTKPPTVSPGQYYTINNHLISSILTALMTYAIVLLQFDNGDKAKGNYYKFHEITNGSHSSSY